MVESSHSSIFDSDIDEKSEIQEKSTSKPSKENGSPSPK